jgi:hypothetical protein
MICCVSANPLFGFGVVSAMANERIGGGYLPRGASVDE